MDIYPREVEKCKSLSKVELRVSRHLSQWEKILVVINFLFHSTKEPAKLRNQVPWIF